MSAVLEVDDRTSIIKVYKVQRMTMVMVITNSRAI